MTFYDEFIFSKEHVYLVCILETLESFMITAFFPAKSCKMENGELSHFKGETKIDLL